MKSPTSLVTLILLSILFYSCGGDDEMEEKFPNYIRTWGMTYVWDYCPNPDNNVQVDGGEYGYCRSVTNGGEECIMLTLDLNENG